MGEEEQRERGDVVEERDGEWDAHVWRSDGRRRNIKVVGYRESEYGR